MDDEPTKPAKAPANEGIYRAIQWLLFLDVVLGLGLAVFGAVALEAESIAYAGLGLAVVGLLLMVFFRVLAAREEAARRHEADGARHQRLRRAVGGQNLQDRELRGRADAD